MVQLQTRKGSDGAVDDDDDAPETSASNTRSVDPRFWLGPEPNLLDVATEEQGVADILAALSSEEREQVQRDDTSMPIRHFRAEKVSGRFFFVSSSFVRHLLTNVFTPYLQPSRGRPRTYLASPGQH